MKIRAHDFKNPYPAFSSVVSSLEDTAVLAQIGIQHHHAPDSHEIRDQLLQALKPAVYQVEAGAHVDAAGLVNEVLLTYWETGADYQRWRALQPMSAWADGSSRQDVGFWVEALKVPARRFETSYSTEDAAWGMAKARRKELNPFHSYFGSMRDRIHDAEDGGLPDTTGAVKTGLMVTRGRYVSFDIPENMCFIRSPQGWHHCPEAERDWFEAEMLPVFQAGVDYLADNSLTTGCLSIRKIDLDHPADSQIQTSSLAWWRSLAHLEVWAHEHPTHLAILRSFGELARQFAPDVTVILGHEVYVVPAGGARAEYLNCNEQTGLLPFADHLSRVGAEQMQPTEL